MENEIVNHHLSQLSSLPIEAKVSKFFTYLHCHDFLKTFNTENFQEERENLLKEIRQYLSPLLEKCRHHSVQEDEIKEIKVEMSQMAEKNGFTSDKLQHLEIVIQGNHDTPFPALFKIVNVMSHTLCQLSVPSVMTCLKPEISTIFMQKYQQWNQDSIANRSQAAMIQSQLDVLDNLTKKRPNRESTPSVKRVKTESKPNRDKFEEFPEIDSTKSTVEPKLHCQDPNCGFVKRGPSIQKPGYVALYTICHDLDIHPLQTSGTRQMDSLGHWCRSHADRFKLIYTTESALILAHRLYRSKAGAPWVWYCPKEKVEEFKENLKQEWNVPRSRQTSRQSVQESSPEPVESREVTPQPLDGSKIVSHVGFPDIDLTKNPCKPYRHCNDALCNFNERGPPIQVAGYVSIYNIAIGIPYHPYQTKQTKQMSGFSQWLQHQSENFGLISNTETCLMEYHDYSQGKPPMNFFCPKDRVKEFTKVMKKRYISDPIPPFDPSQHEQVFYESESTDASLESTDESESDEDVKKGFPKLDKSLENMVNPIRHCDNVDCVYVRNGPPLVKRGYVPVYTIALQEDYHPTNTAELSPWFTRKKDRFNLKMTNDSTLYTPNRGRPFRHVYVPEDKVEEFRKALRGEFIDIDELETQGSDTAIESCGSDEGEEKSVSEKSVVVSEKSVTVPQNPTVVRIPKNDAPMIPSDVRQNYPQYPIPRDYPNPDYGFRGPLVDRIHQDPRTAFVHNYTPVNTQPPFVQRGYQGNPGNFWHSGFR